MKHLIIVMILIQLLLVLLIIMANYHLTNPIVYGYDLEITSDSIYVTDEKDIIIYKEKVQWDNPSPLQQALINNNK